ncbi:T3SS effector HopA1 family protein [Streptomyces sp. NPDC048606]|uniref:T3SS effector HopA1 family protein n=1 Tax=Streptomyces sp. NPDC048606 TaxID=3154726 RepID=UPI003439067B
MTLTLPLPAPVPLADVLAPRLSAALDLVTVRADGLRATVSGREITTESPRDLRGRLAHALYEEFHAGNGAQRGEPGGAPRRNLRDADLERRFAAGVPHAWTPARARLIEVLDRPGGAQLVVRMPDITARVPADRLVGDLDAVRPGDVVELALEAARPALSPGFFYVMGSRALPRPAGPIRRVFLHAVDGDAAAGLWEAALHALEGVGALYHAKALSDPDDFPRRDGLVVYLHGAHEAAERAVVEAVRDLPGRGADTSLFTERLAPGVAAAWDPRDPRPGQSSMSFGQHRSFALATALVDHATAAGGWAAGAARGPLEERVAREFRKAGIDPLRPENNIATTEGN